MNDRLAVGEQADRAAAVAFEERGDRSTRRVEGERCLHLQQTDGTIGGQLVSDRTPAMPPPITSTS